MDKTKNTRKNYGTAYYATAFLAAFFFEFYWIMTDPYNYFMLLGTGFIMIIMGYLTIDSLLKAKADNDAIKNEQNEMMLKAQKAIYIATKKNSKDSAVRQAQSIKAMELMMNKMISSQQALLEEKNGDDMNALIDQLSASNAKLAREVQSALTVNQLVKANADLVKNVKEALSASAMNSQDSIDLNAYVNEAVNSPATPPATTTAKANVAVEPVINEPVVEPVTEDETLVSDDEVSFSPDIDIPVSNDEEAFSSDIDIPVSDDREAFSPDTDLSVASDFVTPTNEISDFDIPDLNIDLNIEDTTDMAPISIAEEIGEETITREDLNNEEIVSDALPDEPIVDDAFLDETVVNDELTEETITEDAFLDETVVEDELIEETIAEDPFVNETIAEDELIGETIVDEQIVDDGFAEDELISDVSINFEADTMDAIENEINIAEMERSEALEAMTIPDEMTPELDEVMSQGNPEEIMEAVEENDVVEEDAEDEIEPLDLASGEIPNRQLTDEEIAALFASL